MAQPIAGLIEGFYGRPWTWEERIEVARACAERGMRHYVYAPKDDPKHRRDWRVPYDRAELEGFSALVAEGALDVGFAISPGLSIDYGSAGDREALLAKVGQLLDAGVALVCLALDDIPNRPGLGAAHAQLTAWLHERIAARTSLVLVPTEYVGVEPSPYLDELARGVPDDVPIAWTGMSVVNDEITARQARARAAALGGRPPLLWDNHPVNDAIMADRLFMGPLVGRDPDLLRVCAGYLANPMVQPRCSKLPLASVAAWLRGDDPVGAWVREADAAGLRAFAEACDGRVPRRLVAALVDDSGGGGWHESASALARWLERAAECEAPGLEGEADPWVAQVRAEAAAGLAALRLYQASRPVVRIGPDGHGRAAAPDDALAIRAGFGLAGRLPALRRSGLSVLGVRLGFRPSIGQRAGGGWALLAEGMQEDENAVDTLARAAWRAAAAPSPDVLAVEADGAPVAIAVDGTFRVDPSATVLVRCGPTVTCVRVPAEPPLDDPRLG